jgi:hypothetical protein
MLQSRGSAARWSVRGGGGYRGLGLTACLGWISEAARSLGRGGGRWVEQARLRNASASRMHPAFTHAQPGRLWGSESGVSRWVRQMRALGPAAPAMMGCSRAVGHWLVWGLGLVGMLSRLRATAYIIMNIPVDDLISQHAQCIRDPRRLPVSLPCPSRDPGCQSPATMTAAVL